VKFISSRDNPAFKRLGRLAADARFRREEGATLIDGDHLIESALQTNWPLTRLVISEAVVESPLVTGLLERVGGIEVLVFAAPLFKQISPVVTPTGVLAEIAVPTGPTLTASGTDDVLALAGVQDAGNLGSLLRTALAAGVRHIWLDAQTTQAWSPKAMRAGMGAQFSLYIEEGCRLEDRLQESSRRVLVTSLGAGCVSLYQLELRTPAIWVFGAEGQGVPVDIQSLASQRVRIPMAEPTESLNVGAACAVCLFEQARQRI
jgi:RNA methyltransferase, TrmH family